MGYTFEAEESEGYGVITDTKHIGYSGSGFIDFKPNQPGGNIQFQPILDKEGIYSFTLRYAHTEQNRPLEIDINNETIIKSLDIPGTSSWSDWSTISFSAKLKRGENIITLTAIGDSGGPNIDSLSLTYGNQIKTSEQTKISLGDFLTAEQLNNLKTLDLFYPTKNKLPVNSSDTVKIKSVYTVSENIILITLNGSYENINPEDITVKYATGNWNDLNPKLKTIKVKEYMTGVDGGGDTTLLYKISNTYPLQEVNEIHDLETAITKANNIISWQMSHGGWDKNNNISFKRAWNGTESKSKSGWKSADGTPLGTIDNDATTSELYYISKVYRETKDENIFNAITKGVDFLLNMQYPSGGFPQVYPVRSRPGSSSYYSNYVTFNDGAMINVLEFFDDIINRRYPFDTFSFDETYIKKIEDSLFRATDYILKSQIVSKGELTAWCAQHDPVTYEPLGARSYEHPSISGSESVGILKFLISKQEKSPEIQKAVSSALKWFNSVKLNNVQYIRKDKNKQYFIEKSGYETWYRFYDIKTMEPIFSGRDGIIKRNILEIEEERRHGYSWAGKWPIKLLTVWNRYGYFPHQIYVEFNGSTTKVNNELLAGF